MQKWYNNYKKYCTNLTVIINGCYLPPTDNPISPKTQHVNRTGCPGNNRSIVVVLASENTRIIRMTVLMIFLNIYVAPRIGEHFN